MADILKILLLVLGILIIYVSYWLLAEALFPEFVERASQKYSQPVRLSAVGVLFAVLPVGLGIVVSNLPNPVLKVLGLTMIVTPVLLGLAGSAGLTRRIGAGLASPLDETQPWRRVLRGGILLACSFLLPVVGWFILPIWMLVSGFGAFVICVREHHEERKSQNPASFEPLNEAAG